MRLVVSGYYGFGNLGDEAVLAGLLRAFEERGSIPRSAFTVLSAAPRDTFERHGVAAAPRMRPASLVGALRQADLALSGGGSLLQDATSLRSLAYYLFVLRLAAAMGKPFALVAQGLGPLRRPLARVAVRRVLNRALCITVRDEGSAQLLARIGVSQPRIAVTADPVFALPPPDADRGRAVLKAGGAPSGPVVGLALRPWRGAKDIAALGAAAAEAIERETGLPVVLLPMHRSGDLALAEDIERASGGRARAIRPALSVEDARGVAAACEALVGMRLHALLFAVAACVPAVAVSYDPKVAAFMREIGQDDLSLTLEEAEAGRIAEGVRRALAERTERVAALKAQGSALAERARRNADLVMSAWSGRA